MRNSSLVSVASTIAHDLHGKAMRVGAGISTNYHIDTRHTHMGMYVPTVGPKAQTEYSSRARPSSRAH